MIDIIDESDTVKRYFIKVSDKIPFSFTAGQFVMLDLPVGDKEIDRSYSIASPPTDNNTFELIVVLKPGGTGTNYLFNHVTIGTELKTTKALGKFKLPENIDSDICFVCTGTGIAPLRSMLHDLFNKNIPHKNLFLIFGNRWIKDILYKKEMEELAQKHSEFRFIPVLSRDNPGWTGYKGYVHSVYETMFAHKPRMYFYICGWHQMLSEARNRIAAMGYDKSKIKFELYD